MMGLSCSCHEWDGEGWYFVRRESYSKPFYHQGEPIYDTEFFFPLQAKRSRQCRSCGVKIKPGNTCVEFERYRACKHEIETRIYDESTGVPMASWFLCETCGEIYANLEAIGYCIQPDENMNELLQEYLKMVA